MKEKINLWSFVSSIISVVLFFSYSFVPSVGKTNSSYVFLHPLAIILYMTLITFYFGLLGFSRVKGWKGMVRSVWTIVSTLGLLVILSFILFFGSLLS